MHDDQLERRLRAALTDEAQNLPFTITAAELQRRAVIRGRGGNQRLTLLLAAAVAIGALGVGSLIGGAMQRRSPEATAPVTAIGTASPGPGLSAGPTGPAALPTLQEMLDAATGDVLVAQSHDLIDGNADASRQLDGAPSSITFPEMHAAGDYEIEIVCLGHEPMEYQLGDSASGTRRETLLCDGSTLKAGLQTNVFPRLSLWYREPTSWRLVVRGTAIALPLPTENPILDPFAGNVEELSRLDDQTMDSTESWGDTGLVLQELPPLPGRFDYVVRIWCPWGESVRLILGDHLENGAELTPETETALRCDGLVKDLDLRMVEPHGSRVFLAAAPGARWSVLLASPRPPVAIVQQMPGWQLSTGFGPEYAFQTHGVSLSNGGVEGGGPLLVALECAGPAQQVEITVDLSEPLGNSGKTFLADCAPDGARTAQSFVTKGDGYLVEFTARAGTWIALTALVPDPLPTPAR